MDILILGNGFDLAHGLKTSYKDFLNYCIEKNNKRLIPAVNYNSYFIDNIWFRHFVNKMQKLGDTWINLEEEIFEVIKNINEQVFEHYGGENKYFQHIMFSYNKDIYDFTFENFIYNLQNNYPYDIDYKKYKEIETNDFSKKFIYIDNFYGLINFIYDQLRAFTKEFEEYLKTEVSHLKNNSKYTLSIHSNNNLIYALSFNYTNTCELLYMNDFNTSIQNLEIKTIYVHGRICNTEDCNLVLGTHSFDNSQISNKQKYIPADFNIFKKHHQRHRYGTIEPYQDLLEKIKKSASKPIFHIIGHSLDITDRAILKHLLLANDNALINIYYHNEEALARMQSNIDLIIGEEEVMAKVRFIPQHDSKRGILLPVEDSVLVEN